MSQTPAISINYLHKTDATRITRHDSYGKTSWQRDGFNLTTGAVQELPAQYALFNADMHALRAHLTRMDDKTGLQALENLFDSSSPFIGLAAQIADTVPVAHRPSARSAVKAQEVFIIAEMLERILGYLPATDKLAAMQVQRTWRDTVEGSVKLKRALGLAGRNDRKYYSPFSKLFYEHTPSDSRRMPAGISFDDRFQSLSLYRPSKSSTRHPNSGPIHGALPVDIRFTGAIDTDVATRIGAMLICNPPIHSLQVHSKCRACKRAGKMFSTSKKMIYPDSREGFTVKQLLECDRDIRREACACGKADIGFAGIIEVMNDDMAFKVIRGSMALK